jgi:hypothetical protein
VTGRRTGSVRQRLAAAVAVTVVLAPLLSDGQPAVAHGNLTRTSRLRAAISSYVASRDGAISVAVYDGVARRLLVFHPKLRGRTVSIVKVDILQTLLHRTDGRLSAGQRQTAAAMIEQSSNSATDELWGEVGGARGVHRYNRALGLKQTHPHPLWGLTRTSAADQVTLVRELLGHSSLLTTRGRRFQRRLMRNVELGQRWGITSGVPKHVEVGIKDGWSPINADGYRWAVNSIGWVRGHGRRYVIAVVTQHNGSEGYGIQSVEHISKLVWRHMTVGRSRN